MLNRKLTDTLEMPFLGFGTYLIPDDEAAELVADAIAAGYRHIDTAEGYNNESGVGAGIRRGITEQNLTREDIFVTTKLWPGNPAWGQPFKTTEETIAALNASLDRLGLDYVDLYLIHAPYSPEQRLSQWQALVALQKQGKARAIGVSNFNQAHIEELRAAGLPMPSANQIELHPWCQRPQLVSYLNDHGIVPIAYSSLIPLSTWRAVEGQRSAKTEDMKAEGAQADSPFKKMAAKYGVSEAQVLLRWAVQMGFPVLPKSSNAGRLRTNADIFGFELDEADMALMATLDRGDGVAWATGDPTKAG